MNATEQEINAAEAFLLRARIPLERDHDYLDITGALFAAAAHMDAGSEVMQLALNIERIRKTRKGIGQ